MGRTMDAANIVGIVIGSIFGGLLLVTCIISAVKAVRDRRKIKEKIAAKHAARIILGKPLGKTVGRQLSRSSEDVLSPEVSCGGGLIAERMRLEEQRRRQNRSPSRRQFEPITSDWRSENRLEKRQYLQRSIRRQSETEEDFKTRCDMELKQRTEWTENGRRRRLYPCDPYFDYFSNSSREKLYIDQRWDDEVRNGSKSRSVADIRSPQKVNSYRSSPYGNREGRSSSLSNGSDKKVVYRSRSAELLRNSSRLSIRRNSYEAAMENDDLFFTNRLHPSEKGEHTHSARIINIYRYDPNGDVGMENKAYMNSNDILREVSL